MYPAILQQSLATLFPYLETLQDYLVRSDPASPLSGAAKGNQAQSQKGNPKANPYARQKGQTVPAPHPCTVYALGWGPNGSFAYAAVAPPPIAYVNLFA
jgi:hypothetical protein